MSKTKVRHKKNSRMSKQLVFIFLGGAVALLIFAFGLKNLEAKPFCANSESCIKDLSGKIDKDATTGVFEGREVKVPSQVLAQYVNPTKKVLGENTGNKKIAVDLSRQHLYAYEGDTVVMDFPVSTGKWHYTPTGVYNIWVKLRYTKMEGGSKALNTYYYLPNVPFTMFFANSDVPRSDGYSIHGAYWHNNFGHPMSHGCVNMAIEAAGAIFAWADPQATGWASKTTADNPGTQVVVYGVTPTE